MTPLKKASFLRNVFVAFCFYNLEIPLGIQMATLVEDTKKISGVN